jgi:uncharacterized protein (TIGR00661 family)
MTGKNILICPLEWGLGHAARMIPVANRLKQRGHNIFIGAGGEHLALLKAELPDAHFISFPGFSPGYSRYLPSYLVMLFKIPVLAWHIVSEHRKLKDIIRDHSIDVVISDNRFGLWSRKVKCIYFTHMVRIPFPRPFRFLEFTGIAAHRFFIRRYDACFIPDLPGENNVSGRLSHGLRLPSHTMYAGILSRFSGVTPAQHCKVAQKHNTIILSGPEPQKSLLKEKLENRFMAKKPVTVILGGTPSLGVAMDQSEGLIRFTHLAAPDMARMLAESESVISRSGYTTIMELISLNVSALLIPTPGQTEQEYLAQYLGSKGWFLSSSQKKCSEAGLASAKAVFDGKAMMEESSRLLDEALDFLEK